MGYVEPMQAGARAKEHAEIALSIDDTNAEAYFQLAVVATWTDWDFAATEPLFLRAMELKPGFADSFAMYSHYLSILGRHDEALASIERAVDLDGLNLHFRSPYCVVLYRAQRYEQAVAQARQALSVAADMTLALVGMSSALYALERYDEVIEVEEQLLEIIVGTSDVAVAGM